MFIHHSSFRDVYHYQLTCSHGEQERMKELSESEVPHHRDAINSLWAVGLADQQPSLGDKMVFCRSDEVNLSHHWYNKNNNIISICFHSFLDYILFIYPITLKHLCMLLQAVWVSYFQKNANGILSQNEELASCMVCLLPDVMKGVSFHFKRRISG